MNTMDWGSPVMGTLRERQAGQQKTESITISEAYFEAVQ